MDKIKSMVYLQHPFKKGNAIYANMIRGVWLMCPEKVLFLVSKRPDPTSSLHQGGKLWAKYVGLPSQQTLLPKGDNWVLQDPLRPRHLSVALCIWGGYLSIFHPEPFTTLCTHLLWTPEWGCSRAPMGLWTHCGLISSYLYFCFYHTDNDF